MTPYNLYKGFKEKNFMEIVKRKPRIHHLRNKCCDIIEDGHKLIISDPDMGGEKVGKRLKFSIKAD